MAAGNGVWPSGGVLAASYATPVASPARGGAPATRASGLNFGPVGPVSLLAMLMIFGGAALIFTLLLLDALGRGPRHRLWREQVMRRLSTTALGGGRASGLYRRLGRAANRYRHLGQAPGRSRRLR
jgi:hypothetical protein